MRRSHAPSFRGPNTTVGTSSVSSQSTGIVKNIRSTANILNLLKDSDNNTPTIESEPVTPEPVIDKDCSTPSSQVEKVYNIVYGKQTKKKHKTWEGDGTLHAGNKFLTAKDDTGKIIGTIPVSKCKELTEGTRLFFGSKEVEVIEEASLVVPEKRKADTIEPVTIKKPRSLGKTFQKPLEESELFILPEPPADHQWSFSNGRPMSAVAVEPWLAKKLRPHQRQGVTFLYECIMGFKDTAISGAILADEMGLGKTLQCIALVWTLLRQGPYGRPAVQRVLIVTPSSLTGNWAAEFKKWLGIERLEPFVIDARHKPKDRHPNQRVVIVSYEMLMRHREGMNDTFDLLICDEAHRLKNADTKASQALNDLGASKRILLTGTPMQNDLQEFFALADFANPNCVGNFSSFRRKFEDPILAARQREATEEVRAIGEDVAQELNQLTRVFILRRTQSVLDSFLPRKKEVVVFCRASPVQVSVYNSILDSLNNTMMGSDGSFHLGVISSLRKVASHPALLSESKGSIEEDGDGTFTAKQARSCVEENDFTLPEHSGKLMVLLNFLSQLYKSSPRERVVLVSAFTSTLDMLEQLCQTHQYPTLRLDGSTPSNQRTDIVSRFNNDCNQFVFLLSAKAGGVGLNLVGASRLVLFDSDWNPATDLQAMARIWRDGQRREVFIYRLLSAGTIEEKMFQRQLSKQTIAGGIVDAQSSNSVLLSRDDLKDIFAYCPEEQECWTHTSLGCDCEGIGVIPDTVSSKENRSCEMVDSRPTSAGVLRMEELMNWEHHGPPIGQETLQNLMLEKSADLITFIFCTS